MSYSSYRRIVFCGVILLLMIPLSVWAEPSPVYISLAKGNEYEIAVGDSVVFGWGWATISKGLTNNFVRLTEQSWSLRDSEGSILAEYLSQGSEGWGELYEYQIGADWNCPAKWASGEEYGWARHWDQDPGITFDEPGIYYLDFYRDLEKSIHDPCDIDADGKPDIYDSRSNFITIFVSE